MLDPGNADPCHLLYSDGASSIDVLSPGDASRRQERPAVAMGRDQLGPDPNAPDLVDLDMLSSTLRRGLSATKKCTTGTGTAWTSIAAYNGYYLQDIEMFGRLTAGLSD